MEPTKSASGRSRTRVAKAASISRLVLAVRIWICSASRRAAASTALNWLSAFVASAELTSKATRPAPGTSSCSNSSRLAANSILKKLIPCQVAVGPGEIGDETKPDRVFEDAEKVGIDVVAALAANDMQPVGGGQKKQARFVSCLAAPAIVYATRRGGQKKQARFLTLAGASPRAAPEASAMR